MKLFLSFIFFLVSISVTFAQEGDSENVSDAIERIFSKSDHLTLGKMFSTTVHLDLPKHTGQWSSTQAMYMVKEFFDNNPIKLFEVLQYGTNMSNNTFLAGTYTTITTIFDVYIVFKEENNKLCVYKLNIREQ